MKYIYFIKPIGLDGPVKIGCSDCPENRLLSLASWSPWPLEIIGCVQGVIRDETFLHRCFAGQHSHHEWFRPSVALREAISEVLAAKTVSVLHGKLDPSGSIRTLRQARSPRTPERRRCASYSSRVTWAMKNLRRLDENGAWYTPDDVGDIIIRWTRGANRKPPTDEEVIRLDAFLADPTAHSVIPPWKKVAA